MRNAILVCFRRIGMSVIEFFCTQCVGDKWWGMCTVAWDEALDLDPLLGGWGLRSRKYGRWWWWEMFADDDDGQLPAVWLQWTVVLKGNGRCLGRWWRWTIEGGTIAMDDGDSNGLSTSQWEMSAEGEGRKMSVGGMASWWASADIGENQLQKNGCLPSWPKT